MRDEECMLCDCLKMRNVCYVIVSRMRDEECMLCDCLKDER